MRARDPVTPHPERIQTMDHGTLRPARCVRVATQLLTSEGHLPQVSLDAASKVSGVSTWSETGTPSLLAETDALNSHQREGPAISSWNGRQIRSSAKKLKLDSSAFQPHVKARNPWLP